jgi:hypothetical protein
VDKQFNTDLKLLGCRAEARAAIACPSTLSGRTAAWFFSSLQVIFARLSKMACKEEIQYERYTV